MKKIISILLLSNSILAQTAKLDTNTILIGQQINFTITNKVSNTEVWPAYDKFIVENIEIIKSLITSKVFKDGARVDVGSIIASTLNLKDKDFINDKYVFEKNGFIKVEVALAKGKKDYDKRKKIEEKRVSKEIRDYK